MRRNRRCVEHHASANRHHRRKLTHDEAVAGQQQGGLGQAQLGHRGFSRRQLASGHAEHDRGNGFGSVGVQMHARPVFQGLGRRQQRERHVQTRSGVKGRGRRQHHAARQFFAWSPRPDSTPCAGRPPLARPPAHAPALRARARAGLREKLPVHLPCESCPRPACPSPPRRSLSW